MNLAIDERVGCIAVVDLDEVSSPCLGPTYPGVLWFAYGRPVRWHDRMLGLDGPDDVWVVPTSLRREAERQLRRLRRLTEEA